MPRLSLAALANGRPGQYPDPAVEGLRFRVRDTGRIYAELRWKGHDGRWTSTHLGRLSVTDRLSDLLDGHSAFDEQPSAPTLEDVLAPIREQAKAARRELRKGNVPGGANTLEAAINRYLSHIRSRPKPLRPATLRELERYLLKVWAPLHKRPIAAITRGEVQAQLDEMAARAGPATNRARTALSGLFRWAHTRDLVTASPIEATDTVDETSRDRVLSLTELRRLWAATEKPGVPAAFGAILKLLILTGQRRTEVGDMKWAELDLDGALWSLPASRTKNGRPHAVPLPEAAVVVLRALERRGEHVFGERGGYTNWSQSKRRLDALVKLPHWVIHDVRRSVVSGMGEIGVEPHIVESAINHISGFRAGVAGTYNRAQYLTQRTEAFRRWAEHLLDTAPAKVIQLHA